MSRQEKKTRIKMLPPKVQLQQRDALTGSYPTITRFSTDGRTGNYPISYNDLQTIVFTSSSSNNSWQNNLVAYWTMQKNIEGNGLIGGLALVTEKNINNLSQGFLDFSLTNNFAFSFYSAYGINEDHPFTGKGYEINLNKVTQSNNATIPCFISNKNYDFSPRFSAFARAQINTSTRPPALLQYVDTNKSLCTATGSWDTGPNPFTVAGWLKVNDIISERNAFTLIAGPTRYSVYNSNSDYELIINSPSPGTKRFIFDVRSGSIGYLQVQQTATYNDSDIFNKWFHIAATYDGKTKRVTSSDPKGTANNDSLKIYLNGNRLPTNSLASSSDFKGFLSGTQPQYGISALKFTKHPLGTNMAMTGSIAELAFFNKELSAQEINEIYNSKIPLNKKNRVLAGTSININNNPYPIDSGEYMTSFNGDGMLITGSVVKGIGDNPEWVHFTPGQEMQPFRDNDQPAVDGKSTNNPFYATGSAISNVGEGFTSPLWSKNKIEIDISVAAPCSGTMFLSGVFFTGSLSAGTSNGNPIAPANTQGLSQEMMYYNFENKIWQGVGLGYPIGFLNRGLFGDAVGSLSDGRNPRLPYDNKIMMGFAPGIVNLIAGLDSTQDSIFRTQVTGVFEWQASAGEPITSFGFPYHPKFHATSSQLLNMSNYITEPFLLEKIVVELSAAYTLFGNTYNTASYEVAYGATPVPITSITQSTVPAAINNFFILNQRRPNNFNYQEQLLNDFIGKAILTTSLPTTIQLSPQGPSVYVDTIRDIITWGGVSSFASNITTNSFRAGAGVNEVVYGQVGTTVAPLSNDTKALMTRDCVFSSINEAHDDLTPLNWSGKVYMELPAKSPIKIGPEGEIENLFSFFTVGQNFNGLQSFWNLKYDGGGRNALGIVVPNARNYINPVAQVQTNGSFKNAFNGGKENIFVISDNHYRYNPYILLPSDNLILGWQQPFLNVTYISGSSNVPNKFLNAKSGSFSEIKFLPGPAKVTLYGSYIREGREYNDGTNQLLSSDNVHEVIE